MPAAVRWLTVACILVTLGPVPAPCRARPQTRTPAPAPDIERSFLLWKMNDAAAARTKLEVCVEKHVTPEVTKLCDEAFRERELETEIAEGYWFEFYGEKPPAVRQPPTSLTSQDGAKFESKFLKQMLRQDREGLERTQKCLADAGRSEIQNFCHLVERSRSPEILLLEDQLCQLETRKCRLTWPKP